LQALLERESQVPLPPTFFGEMGQILKELSAKAQGLAFLSMGPILLMMKANTNQP
jgi:hypothetical protein